MSEFLFKPDAKNVEVIGVGVAQNLKPDQLLSEANKLCDELKKVQGSVIRRFVHLDQSDMTGVVMERAGVFTIFIGLGLEVIQATQGFAK